MKIRNKYIVLLGIIVIATVLRVYKLGSIPPSLTPDEASLGYNAYSIFKTGRDEHGVFLPIIFKSFGDYKPGLYVYADVPFVALMGLNEVSTRLPGVVFGVLAVYLMYLVSRQLFKDERFALISSFVLAILPWHFYFSRGAWEINLSLTLTLAAIYFFLLGLVKKRFLLLSAFFFGLTLLAYQGAKLSSAIVLALLIIFFFKEFSKVGLKYITLAILSGLITSSPIILSLFNGQSGRLAVFSVFSSPRPGGYLQSILNQGGEIKNSFNYYLFHPEWLNFLRGIMGRWFNHFSGRFLFFEGDFGNYVHSAPYSGMLSLGDLPLLVSGMVSLVKKNLRREYGLILAWLLLAPLPAVLTRDQVHAVRSFNVVVPLAFVLSFGVNFVWNRLRKRKYLLFSLVLIYLFGYVYYLDAYFVHLPKLNSKYWEYGYKQVVETVTPLESSYENIIVQQGYAQPYIYFLFYNKYDPVKYQAESKTNFVSSLYGDVGQVTHLDNIYFDGIEWQILRGRSGTLVVGDADRIPRVDSLEGAEFRVISDIKYLDNRNTAFRVIEIK